MKNTTDSLPAELQAFASPLDSQSPEVQEASQFLLVARCLPWPQSVPFSVRYCCLPNLTMILHLMHA